MSDDISYLYVDPEVTKAFEILDKERNGKEEKTKDD